MKEQLTIKRRKAWNSLSLGLICLNFLLSTSVDAAPLTPTPANLNKTESTDIPASGNEQQSVAKGQVSPSIQVFLPPILEKNKPVWGSIYDAAGNTLAQQKILFNKQECVSDEFGSFNFMVPADASVLIRVPSETGKSLFEVNYTSTARGFLLSDPAAADLIDKLDLLSSFSGTEPVISHAPSVVEELQTIVLVGKNFSGKQGEDELEIGNRNADILAASPRCIVAVTNRQMKIGPIKEMKVLSHDQSSLPVELDICRLEPKQDLVDGGKSRLRIIILGTTLPVVVALSNQSKFANLRFGGWRLGSQNIFLSQGGLQNSFVVDPTASLNDTDISAHIISNGLFDPYSLKTSRNLLSKSISEAEEEAELLRLKKRAIGLESQLNSISNERTLRFKTGKLSVEEESKLDVSSKSASSRMFRIERMLQSRRAVIESYGSADYDKLIETASNSGVANLDAVIVGKDLGFSESRLLKIVAKRAAEEQRQAQAESSAWTYNYNSPASAVLQSYRKKYGKRGYVPPPPSMATLIPPPAPFKPNMNDLGPFMPEISTPPPAVLAHKKSKKSKTAEGRSRSVENRSRSSENRSRSTENKSRSAKYRIVKSKR